jgi:hypothetical protein
MSQFRILDYNYAFDPSVGISATSEDSNFPASNLSKRFRSKVWRSSGTFVITSSNNKLNFKESGGGSELTATLTNGTYSPAELASEIKSGMEAAGAATYTVSHSTATGKWTLSTAGAYLSLLRSTGTDVANSVWSAIGFATLSDSTGSLSYTGSKIAIHTVERVVFDLRTTEDIDSFAMLSNPMNSGGFKFSESAVIRLKGSASNSWDAPLVTVTLSIDDVHDAITHFFALAQTCRFWAVEMIDPSNASLYVELSKVFLSKATQLSQTPEIGFTDTATDRSNVTETPYGHRYADIYPNRRAIELSYSAMTESDIQTLQSIFKRVGAVTPIAAALDPQATLFDKDRFFIYGYLSDKLQATNRFYSYFDSGLTLTEGM